MEIDVAGAGVRHHKAKALLVVEELDLAFDHRPGRTGIAPAVAIAAATAETATVAEAVAAAETPATAAEIAPGAARRRLRRGKIDRVNRHDLQSARRIRQVADDGGAGRQFRMPCRLQRRSVAEGVAAIIQGDEAITLGAVEPLDLALRGGLRD